MREPDHLNESASPHLVKLPQESAKMPEVRMKVAPGTVAYADGENHKLIVDSPSQERQRRPSI